MNYWIAVITGVIHRMFSPLSSTLTLQDTDLMLARRAGGTGLGIWAQQVQHTGDHYLIVYKYLLILAKPCLLDAT